MPTYKKRSTISPAEKERFRNASFDEKIKLINEKLDAAKESAKGNVKSLIDNTADLEKLEQGSDELGQMATLFKNQARQARPWWHRMFEKVRDNIDLNPMHWGIKEGDAPIYTPEQLDLASHHLKKGYFDPNKRGTYKDGFFNIKPSENEALKGDDLVQAVYSNDKNKALDHAYRRMKSLERQGKINSKDWRLNRQLIKELSGKDISFTPNKNKILSSLKDYDYDLAKAVSKEFKGMQYIYPQDIAKINSAAHKIGIQDFNAYDFPSINREMEYMGDYKNYSEAYTSIKDNEQLVDGVAKYTGRKIAEGNLGKYGASIGEEVGKQLINEGSVSSKGLAKGLARGAIPMSSELALGKDIARNAGRQIKETILNREKLNHSWKDSVRSKYIDAKNYANKKLSDFSEGLSRGGIEVSRDNPNHLKVLENTFRKRIYPNLHSKIASKVDKALEQNPSEFLTQWLQNPNERFRPEHYFDNLSKPLITYNRPAFQSIGLENTQISDIITRLATKNNIHSINDGIEYSYSHPFEFLLSMEENYPELSSKMFPNGMQDIKEYLANAKIKIANSDPAELSKFDMQHFVPEVHQEMPKELLDRVHTGVKNKFGSDADVSDINDFLSANEEPEEDFLSAIDHIENTVAPSLEDEPINLEDFYDASDQMPLTQENLNKLQNYTPEQMNDYLGANQEILNKLNSYDQVKGQIFNDIGVQSPEIQKAISKIAIKHEIGSIEQAVRYVADHPKEFLRTVQEINPELAANMFPNGAEDLLQYLNKLEQGLANVHPSSLGAKINHPEEEKMVTEFSATKNIGRIADTALPNAPTTEINEVPRMSYDSLGLSNVPTNKINIPRRTNYTSDSLGLPNAPTNKVSIPRSRVIGERRAMPMAAESGSGIIRDTGGAVKQSEGAIAARNRLGQQALDNNRGINMAAEAGGVARGEAAVARNSGRLARVASGAGKVGKAALEAAKLGGDVLMLADLEQKATGMARLWKEDMSRDIEKDGFWGFFEGIWDGIKDSASSSAHYVSKFADGLIDGVEGLVEGGYDLAYKGITGEKAEDWGFKGNYLDRAITKGIGGDPLAERVEDNHSMNPFDTKNGAFSPKGEIGSWVNQGANNLDYIFTGNTGWGGDEVSRQEAMDRRAAEIGLVKNEDGDYIEPHTGKAVISKDGTSMSPTFNGPLSIIGPGVQKINSGWGESNVKSNVYNYPIVSNNAPSPISIGSQGNYPSMSMSHTIGSNIILSNTRSRDNVQGYKF